MATFEVKDGVLHVIDDSACEYKFRIDLIFMVRHSVYISSKHGVFVNNNSIIINSEEQRTEFRELVLRLQREAARPAAAPVVEVKPEPWKPKVGEIAWYEGYKDQPCLIAKRSTEGRYAVVYASKNCMGGSDCGYTEEVELSKFDDSKRAEFADEINLLEAIKKVKGL